jgi:hypothetical protein
MDDVPKSLMFMTPSALELVLRCFVPSLGGLDERPWTAESTLVRGADMVAGLITRSQRCEVTSRMSGLES